MTTREEQAITLLQQILEEGSFFLTAVEAKNCDTSDFVAWAEKAKQLVEQEVTAPQMFIDWRKTGYNDRTCACLIRKVGDTIEILDTQYSPLE